MPDQFVRTELRDGVLMLTMQDPPTRNAIGPDMAREMLAVLDRFERDPEQRVLVLTGAEPSFCSGANVRGFNQRIQERDQQDETPNPLPWGSMEARYAQHLTARPDDVPQVVLRVHELQKPSIAAVNGHAVGAGMGLALACDIRCAAEKATFSEAFVLRGLIPADGSCWLLPRLIGLSNTLLLEYTGDRVDSAEALRLGLVSKVLPDNDLLDSVMELATQLAQGPTRSHSLTKYLVHRSLEMGFRESLELARVAQEEARSTADHREAVQAFLEKRRPNFRGN